MIYQVFVTFATATTPKFVAEKKNEEEARRVATSYDDAKAIFILVNGTRQIWIREAR